MSDASLALQALIAGSVGLALGLFFFGGLWLTLRRLPSVRHPTAWVLASYGLRLLGVGAGLYALTRFGATGVLGGLVGLLAARHLLLRLGPGSLSDASPEGAER